MPTKQIKVSFQVDNNPGTTNNVLVQLNGITKFEGSLPVTGPIIVGADSVTFTSITFDQDIDNYTSTERDPVNIPLLITVTGGSISLESTESNYSKTYTNSGTAESPVWTSNAGTDNVYTLCNVVEQPTWNGEALLNRYDIQYNNGPIENTGPGEIVVYSGETMQTVLSVDRFNNTL
jgi:hypothetical protein